MTEIFIGVFLAALTFTSVFLYIRLRRLGIALNHTLKALTNILETVQLQSEVNTAQQQMNEIINQNLEILGVHTSLIKPSIGFEATQFLAWYNERKGKNGTV